MSNTYVDIEDQYKLQASANDIYVNVIIGNIRGAGDRPTKSPNTKS